MDTVSRRSGGIGRRARLRAWLPLLAVQVQVLSPADYRARSYVEYVTLALWYSRKVFCSSSAVVSVIGHSRRSAHGFTSAKRRRVLLPVRLSRQTAHGHHR